MKAVYYDYKHLQGILGIISCYDFIIIQGTSMLTIIIIKGGTMQ